VAVTVARRGCRSGLFEGARSAAGATEISEPDTSGIQTKKWPATYKRGVYAAF
jgi:hypothetical protein